LKAIVTGNSTGIEPGYFNGFWLFSQKALKVYGQKGGVCLFFYIYDYYFEEMIAKAEDLFGKSQAEIRNLYYLPEEAKRFAFYGDSLVNVYITSAIHKYPGAE
jgi:hypothetical protein